MGCLHRAPEREHTNYLTGLKQVPLRPPPAPTREGGIFAALMRAVPTPQAREMRKNGWISEDTWRLVDERVSARRNPEKYHTRIRCLSRAIAESLKGDRRRRVKAAGAEVETLLGSDPPTEPPRGNTQITSRVSSRFPSDHRPPPRGRAGSLQP